MTTIFRPHWTGLSVLAPHAMLYGSRTTPITQNLDLRDCRGGMLKIGVGRYSTDALNVGLDVIVRQLIGYSDQSFSTQYGAPFQQRTSGLSYSNQLVNDASGYEVGALSIVFDNQAYSTAFAHGDLLCFWGVTTIPAADGEIDGDLEIVRCSSGASTPLVPDAPMNFPRGDNEIFTAADAWNLWLPGGFWYSLVFDAGAVTTTSAVFACVADISIHDYDAKATV